jgi:hypothetical protein
VVVEPVRSTLPVTSVGPIFAVYAVVSNTTGPDGVPEYVNLLPVVVFSIYGFAVPDGRVIVIRVIKPVPPGLPEAVNVEAVFAPDEEHSYQRGSIYKIGTVNLVFANVV